MDLDNSVAVISTRREATLPVTSTLRGSVHSDTMLCFPESREEVKYTPEGFPVSTLFCPPDRHG